MNALIPRAIALSALTLMVSACNGGPGQEAAPEAATPSSPTAAETLQPKVAVGTLQGMQAGDRGCYVQVMDATGAMQEHMASFEVCEDTALVGQEARLFYEPQAVAAASCQGDPDCTDSETVLLLVRVEPMGAAAAPAPTAAPTATAAPAPADPRGQYMGVASTGEPVYYNGISFQCGDLPADDPCWAQPTVSYTIGADEVFGPVDCQAMVLLEAWVGGELVATNLSPQSEAIDKVLSLACYEALG